MVHIKVVHASRILFWLSVVLLVAVLIAAGVWWLRGGAQPAVRPLGTTKLVEQREGAAAVFAAAPLTPHDVVFDGPDENEHTDAHADGFDVIILPRPTPETERTPDPTPNAQGKRVLIYHTHTHEAYRQTPDDPYIENEPGRTTDPAHSVVRVGEELAELLRGFGLTVVHDVTDHEPPKLGTAYVRSLETLNRYRDQNFDLYIDVHRDAYDERIIASRAVSVGGIQAAQLMALIGNGEGFEEKPDTEKNLSFARALTERVNALADGLMRPVLVKVGRYNQHIGTPAILIEVGHHQNTLKEALASLPTLARALAEQLGEGG